MMLAHAGDDPLERYTWKNRLLLVFAPSSDDPRLRAQQDILASVAPGLRERDLVVLQMSPGSEIIIDNRSAPGVDSDRVYRDFDIEKQAFAALLVGKDGTLKLNSNSPLDSRKIFDLIDSMPMRQWEMQNQD